MCAAAMSFARVRRLYFGAGDAKGGAVENGVRFFASPDLPRTGPEVYGGIGESECATLLKDFFQARRWFLHRPVDVLAHAGRSGGVCFWPRHRRRPPVHRADLLSSLRRLPAAGAVAR